MTNRRYLRALVILLIFLVVGPEFGIGLEMLAVMDILGVELFLFALLVGLRLPHVTNLVHSALVRVDRYYFIPTPAQARACPGIVAHAVPGHTDFYVLLALAGLVIAL